MELITFVTESPIAVIIPSIDFPILLKCYKYFSLVEAEKNGTQVFIAGAGLAAALPGVVAAQTTIPVIGVPLIAGSLDGMDALLAIVQMPPGIPVGTVAIGKPGAINAALYAISIMALTDDSLAKLLKNYRAEQAEKVLSAKLD